MFVHGGSAAAREPGKRAKLLEDAGIPHPGLAVRTNGAAMTVAGGMLALGIAPRTAAAVLVGSLVPTTLVGHPFWREEGEPRAAQKIQFTKDLAMLGGLLLVTADKE
jgi:putative oxidoreductase